MRARRRHLTNMYHVLTFFHLPTCQEIYHGINKHNGSIVGGKKEGKERRKEEDREEEDKEREKRSVCVGGNAMSILLLNLTAACLMLVPRPLVIILAQAGNSLRRVLKSQKG